MNPRDYYEVLGLSRNANEADIKRAYRRLAKEFHPDRNKGDARAEERFKEVQQAYAVLSDKDKRARYDQFGHAGVDPRFAQAHGGASRAGSSSNPFEGHWQTWTVEDGEPVDLSDFADIFGIGGGDASTGGDLFERFFGRRGRRTGATASRAHTPARDLEQEVTLTFEQAVRGATLDVEISGGRGASSQRIAVHIPPGVRDGQIIRVRGQGGATSGRQHAGDLHVRCRVQPHRYFRRLEDDLYLDVPITISEAALGAKIDLPTLDGLRTVTVPPGTASGARLRLAGLGVPNPRSGKRGDQYAVIKIVPPARISDEEQHLLKQLQRFERTSPREGLWS